MDTLPLLTRVSTLSKRVKRVYSYQRIGKSHVLFLLGQTEVGFPSREGANFHSITHPFLCTLAALFCSSVLAAEYRKDVRERSYRSRNYVPPSLASCHRLVLKLIYLLLV